MWAMMEKLRMFLQSIFDMKSRSIAAMRGAFICLFCCQMRQAREACGADVAGVPTERGKIDLGPLGQEGESPLFDFFFHLGQKGPSDLGFVAAKGHRAADHN